MMRHLLHPALVHFPIALLIVGGVWEAWGQFLDRQAAIRGGGALTILGTLALLPTVVTGYVAANSVPFSPEAARVLNLHELNGWTVLGLFTALLFWKAWNRGVVPRSHRRVYGALLLVGVVLVAGAAVLGGELVFVHATGVGR